MTEKWRRTFRADRGSVVIGKFLEDEAGMPDLARSAVLEKVLYTTRRQLVGLVIATTVSQGRNPHCCKYWGRPQRCTKKSETPAPRNITRGKAAPKCCFTINSRVAYSLQNTHILPGKLVWLGTGNVGPEGLTTDKPTRIQP